MTLYYGHSTIDLPCFLVLSCTKSGSTLIKIRNVIKSKVQTDIIHYKLEKIIDSNSLIQIIRKPNKLNI